MDLYTKFNHTCNYANQTEKIFIQCMNCILNTYSNQGSSYSCSSSCSCEFKQIQTSICEKCSDIDWVLKDLQIQRSDYCRELCKTDDDYLVDMIKNVNIEITILKKILLVRKFELYNNNKIEGSSVQSAEDKHV